MNLHLDFKKNKFTTAYKILYDYFNHVSETENCLISLSEFRSLYLLLIYDVSRQSEKLKNSVTEIIIKASFKENIPKHTYTYDYHWSATFSWFRFFQPNIYFRHAEFKSAIHLIQSGQVIDLEPIQNILKRVKI